MTPKDKIKILRRLKSAENMIMKGESDLGALSEIVQPLFTQEVHVTWSTDGAVVVDDSGEVGFFRELIDEL